MPAQWVSPNGLVREYLNGESLFALGIKYGVSRETVKAALLRQGVTHRSISEQQIRHYSGTSTAYRKERAMAAHAAIRGRSVPVERQINRAAALMELGKMTLRERAWSDLLRGDGIQTIPQFAVHIFNIDLAVPAAKVAIEVHCGWHNTPKHRRQDQAKKEHLEALGWRVVYVYDRQKHGAAHRRLVELIRLRLSHHLPQ